jgi:hypothetical protein
MTVVLYSCCALYRLSCICQIQALFNLLDTRKGVKRLDMSRLTMGTKEGSSESPFHEQVLLVNGFLGGIAFTGLILVLTDPSTFQPAIFKQWAVIYFYVLIAILAGSSALCILASLAEMQLAGGMVLPGSSTELFGTITSTLGLMGFGAALTMLIFPFTPTGAGLVFLMEVILWIVLGFIVPRDRRKALKALCKQGARCRINRTMKA